MQANIYALQDDLLDVAQKRDVIIALYDFMMEKLWPMRKAANQPPPKPPATEPTRPYEDPTPGPSTSTAGIPFVDAHEPRRQTTKTNRMRPPKEKMPIADNPSHLRHARPRYPEAPSKEEVRRHRLSYFSKSREETLNALGHADLGIDPGELWKPESFSAVPEAMVHRATNTDLPLVRNAKTQTHHGRVAPWPPPRR